MRIRKHQDLGSREARRRLKTSSEPYWLVIEKGLSLGYRKSTEGGAWLVRRYDPARRRHFEQRLGTADDHLDADGTKVLDFGQAQRKLLAQAHQKAVDASGARYTVADAVRDYVDHQRRHRKSADDTEQKLTAYVLPRLGEKRLSELTAADLDVWLGWALKRRRNTRKKNPQAMQGAESKQDAPGQESAPAKENKAELAEQARRRKATLNRVINPLKACLRYAEASGKPIAADTWRRLRKFRGVDSARLRWLTVDEAQRLQNAAPPDLRVLIAAGLHTGCRAGELLALKAGDFEVRTVIKQATNDAPERRERYGTILIADSKSGKPRRVPLTEDGVALFERLTAGKLEDEQLFQRANGSGWYRVALVRAMRAACKAGKVRPAATFHTLRHTYASHLVQAGVPLAFVAEALGHADTRMVSKHYGHLAPSLVADTIRAALPKFGPVPARDNVTDVRARKA